MAQPQLKTVPKGTKIPENKNPFRRRSDIMPEDVNLIVSRLDRIESKVDGLNEDLKEGNREFGQLQEKSKNQGEAIKSIQDNQKRLVWVVVGLIVAFVGKAFFKL